MKTILLLSPIFIFFLLNSSYSQNEIRDYEQPKVSSGSTLLLSSSPFFDTYESIYNYKESRIALDLDIDFNIWRFSKKLNFSFDFSNRNIYTYNISHIEQDGSSSTYYNSFFQLLGGASYYLCKDYLYAGLFSELRANASKNSGPNFHNWVYPNIGTGRIVDAGRVIQTGNLEEVLINEKIISKPLTDIVRKKLTELLDRRYNSEFLDKYKDDNEIEFFSQVEQLLSKEGAINLPLSSRATLKLFQALTNSAFVYFPRYKGYLFQIELASEDYTSNSCWYFRRPGITFAGIYALPLGLRTDLTATAVFSFPAYVSLSNDLFRVQIHSPLTIQEFQKSRYQEYLIPYYASFNGNDLSYESGVRTNIFHNISENIGITFSGEYSFAKRKSGGFPVSFDVRTILNYNILSKMRLDIELGVERASSSKYVFYSSNRISYYIF